MGALLDWRVSKYNRVSGRAFDASVQEWGKDDGRKIASVRGRDGHSSKLPKPSSDRSEVATREWLQQ
jgi:hypothetical protein